MKYAEIVWRDGQPYSPVFDDIYFSSEGGREESYYVFLQQNGLPERWIDQLQFVIGETGFGTGLNFVLTLQQWLQHANDGASLHYLAIEKHPVSPQDIRRLAATWPDLVEYFDALLSVYPLPVGGRHCRQLYNGRVTIHFAFMDVKQALAGFEGCVDSWYLDGFGPAKNPGMWTQEMFQLLAEQSARGASLATFTCAGEVRRGLDAAGFEVSKSPGFGRKREMITAVLASAVDGVSPSPWYDRPLSSPRDRRAVVIGAGIAGLSMAWSLVQRGWRVCVLDRHCVVAQEASGNPAGLLLPRLSLDNAVDNAFYSSAFLFAVHRLDRLQRQARERFWFNDGVYSIDDNARLTDLIAQHDFPEDFMAVASPAALPDYLADRGGRIVHYPAAGWVLPQSLCEALVAVCGESLDMRAVEVGRLEHDSTGWQVLDRDGGCVSAADVVILANGTGVNAFAQTRWLPVSPVRGQVTVMPANVNSARLETALSFDAYVTPQYRGMHCAGASFSRSVTTTSLLQADQDENLDRLERMLPGMFERPTKLQGRVGFRAVSRDRVPVVGAVPDVVAFDTDYAELHHGKTAVTYPAGQYLDGLYVTAAHGSRGLCSSFLAADLLAAMIENVPLPVERAVAEHLNPARFVIRQLRRGPRTGTSDR